ncbi:DJ-1/PfpI family protein [Candidatus Wolfebacteria bacterium]|nr:DJ-1/PfpI family protein [Candidatus Wolfebacteria bacterium]
MANVLFVIAKKDFRDIEYFAPKAILEEAGHNVKIVSNGNAGEIAVGADGGKAEIDMNIKDAKAGDFDAVVFVGGPGALENLDNEQSYSLAKEAIAEKKLLAAICIAPVILAKAGVLKNRKATVWVSPSDKSGIEILKNQGAVYVDKYLVQDNDIITADGPKSAEEFGEKLLTFL